MPTASVFLEIAVVWSDPDMQEVVVSASSGCFSGQVSLYAGWKELADLAERIQGFPSSPTDRREVTLGQDNLPGHGSAKLALYCRDSTGHVAVEVALHAHPVNASEGKQFATVVVPAVVGDVDRFVHELRHANNSVGACALLKGAA